jgi:acyl carrier protein
VQEGISNLIVSQLAVDRASITPATRFDEIGVNLFEMAQLIVSVEETFNVEIFDEEADNLLTVGDLVAYVERKRPQRKCGEQSPPD